jgi:hypothetical protein
MRRNTPPRKILLRFGFSTLPTRGGWKKGGYTAFFML